MNSKTHRIILALAILALAVGIGDALDSAPVGAAVVLGAIFEARVQRERAKAHRREMHLRRRALAWKLYG